jgi:hypothetical protein
MSGLDILDATASALQIVGFICNLDYKQFNYFFPQSPRPPNKGFIYSPDYMSRRPRPKSNMRSEYVDKKCSAWRSVPTRFARLHLNIRSEYKRRSAWRSVPTLIRSTASCIQSNYVDKRCSVPRLVHPPIRTTASYYTIRLRRRKVFRVALGPAPDSHDCILIYNQNT